VDPDRFLGKPDEYLAWAETNHRFNPNWCPRHWMPCPVEGKPGMLATVILFGESFAHMPDNIAPPGSNPASAMNSWMANQTTPLCCKIGDEKIAWLWWVIGLPEDVQCRAHSPEKGIRVCWRLVGHQGEHEWERPLPRSVFDLMAELIPERA
jgi:hypothetical protein